MQENNSLSVPVRYIKGVGPKRSEELARLGIRTAGDMLYYLPARYEDRSDTVRIRDIKMGQHQTIEGTVMSASVKRSKSGKPLFQAIVADATGSIHVSWFNQPYLKDYLIKSAKVILYGKVDWYDRIQMVNPEYEILKDGDISSVHMKRIVPIYPASAELSSKYIRNLSFQAVSVYSASVTDRLPSEMIARLRLSDIRFALKNIHFPLNFEDLEKAYRRIVFEEFFMLQLALAIKRGRSRISNALGYKLDGELMGQFRGSLPFELTDGQKKAISEIFDDMSSGRTMNRLLEGDVGSGKTVVAAHALVLAVESGFQGCLMAPTEVLARQHFIGLSEMLMPLGINVALLVSGIDQDVKDKLYSDVKSGRIDIVVGTHAVIHDPLEFNRLGIAVVDEQHKFGVDQRAALQRKGNKPHMLVMTATPIPRTLALTVFGDLDISVIKGLPKGRKPVSTYCADESKRSNVYSFIKEQIDKGRQAYMICPKVGLTASGDNSANGATGGGPRSVTDTFSGLKDSVFSGYSLGLLHGKLSSQEKEKIMHDFKKGKIDILVSTVVIEVGIDVPNATVMLIENAERFGLSQLHQLRGRVGRGDHASYCILIADPKTADAAERLKAIEETADGFKIAEADLEMRGPGEFFGTSQHGLPEIKFGNLLKDLSIMELARKEAFDIISKDPLLRNSDHRLIREAISDRFKDRLDIMSAA